MQNMSLSVRYICFCLIINQIKLINQIYLFPLPGNTGKTKQNPTPTTLTSKRTEFQFCMVLSRPTWSYSLILEKPWSNLFSTNQKSTCRVMLFNESLWNLIFISKKVLKIDMSMHTVFSCEHSYVPPFQSMVIQSLKLKYERPWRNKKKGSVPVKS